MLEVPLREKNGLQLKGGYNDEGLIIILEYSTILKDIMYLST